MTTYPTRIDEFDLGKWGQIKFKQWLHGATHVFTEDTVNRVAAFIPPGSMAIDIGAYTGDTTIPMALAAGPKGLILAFEPGPTSFPILLDNLDLNAMDNVRPYRNAITSQAGKYTFHYCDPGFINGGFSSALAAGPEGCDNHYAHQVHGVNLTEFLREKLPWSRRLSYVKIDAEGYDKEILKSNRDLFREFRPVIELEVYPFLNRVEREELMFSIGDLDYRWDGPASQFFTDPPNVINVLCHPN